MWMLAAGVKDFNDTRGLHFSQTSPAVQAAVDGHGVALGDSTLVADDLASGMLEKAFELSLRSPAQFAYHLITRRETAERPMTKTGSSRKLLRARDDGKAPPQRDHSCNGHSQCRGEGHGVESMCLVDGAIDGACGSQRDVGGE